MKVYYNGELASTELADGAGTGALTNSSGPFQIGSRSNSVGSGFTVFFKGEIDEVRVYNVAISADQVLTDMQNYGPFNTTGLVMYFDFNDYGSSLANRSTSAAVGPA